MAKWKGLDTYVEYFTGTGQRIQWKSAECEERIKVIVSYLNAHELEEEIEDDIFTLGKVLADIVHHDRIIH